MTIEPHDPAFGIDPEDSARLLELRDTIDRYLGWKNQDDEEHGDYVFRIREIGDMIWNVRAAHLMHDPKLAIDIFLSVVRIDDGEPSEHPGLRKFEVAKQARAENRCSCMAVVHAHLGGVCGAAGAVDFRDPGWPDSMMLCPVCIKHPADEEIESLRKEAARAHRLSDKNRRQRLELRRFNRETRARAEGAAAVVRDGALTAVRNLHRYLKGQSPHWATERATEMMREFLETWIEHDDDLRRRHP